LVEKGANINARARDGSTALSTAYDNGNMEIYNYLKEKGAIEFEPRQVTQSATSSPSTTTVYVQPSVPAQSTPAIPAVPTLQNGRYAASGTAVTMQVGNGMISLYDGVSAVGNGSYRVNGNTITITFYQASGAASSLNGKTYSYTINSSTSFSGNGERWDYRGIM
jgi:ankyrin repeat protein